MEVKSGLYSTEFWKGVLLAILNVAVAAGVVSQADQTQLSGAVTGGVAAVGAMVANAMIVIQYIKSRQALKTVAMETEPSPAPAPHV